MNRVKSNSERWKRQSASHRVGDSCSYGKTRHASSNPGTFFSLLPFAFCLFTLFTACNEPFNPIQQNDQYPFSIHSYLDASQDTNWVRITAVRDSLFMDTPVPLDAVVTLEHLESGNTVTMNDSLFRYFPGNSYAYNFWTDMNIEPEQAYRLTVRRSDGAESHAEVTLPPEFPQPNIIHANTRSFRYMLHVYNVQHLADVLVIYHLILHRGIEVGDIRRAVSFRHLADTLSGPQSLNQIGINTRPHFDALFGLLPYTIVKREVKVSSAGPEWIHFSGLDDNLISLPEGTSNVEGGTGYLIGVVSNTIEWPVE